MKIGHLFQNFLTSKFTHFFVSFLCRKGDFLKTKDGYVNVKNQPIFLKNLISLGIYERQELRLIKNLKDNLDIIELGASLGRITVALCKKEKSKKIITVEANPLLYLNLTLTKQINAFGNLTILNSALTYQNSSVNFELDPRNLGSHIVAEAKQTTVKVKGVKLCDIVKEFQLEEYQLVCDIEGAEIDLLLNEQDLITIDRCKRIVIELHDVEFNGAKYSTEDLRRLVCSKFRMAMKKQIQNAYLFERI